MRKKFIIPLVAVLAGGVPFPDSAAHAINPEAQARQSTIQCLQQYNNCISSCNNWFYNIGAVFTGNNCYTGCDNEAAQGGCNANLGQQVHDEAVQAVGQTAVETVNAVIAPAAAAGHCLGNGISAIFGPNFTPEQVEAAQRECFFAAWQNGLMAWGAIRPLAVGLPLLGYTGTTAWNACLSNPTPENCGGAVGIALVTGVAITIISPRPGPNTEPVTTEPIEAPRPVAEPPAPARPTSGSDLEIVLPEIESPEVPLAPRPVEPPPAQVSHPENSPLSLPEIQELASLIPEITDAYNVKPPATDTPLSGPTDLPPNFGETFIEGLEFLLDAGAFDHLLPKPGDGGSLPSPKPPTYPLDPPSIN